uniref:Storkhead-box protein 1-like n=1 Tax=Pogona vitticeps TaxID=103695 RepID=A0ABM5GIS4_9SAUR
MPRRLEKFLQIAPHSLAIVLSACGGDEIASGAPRRQPEETREEGSGGAGGGGEVAAGEEDEYRDREGEGGRPRSRARRGELPPGPQLGRHHIGYEIFADFKQENMQNFWNKKVTAAVAETFFLGWIDEQVLLIQGKEEHLEVLREGWTRRALKPPAGFHIKCLVQPLEPPENQFWEIFHPFGADFWHALWQP